MKEFYTNNPFLPRTIVPRWNFSEKKIHILMNICIFAVCITYIFLSKVGSNLKLAKIIQGLCPRPCGQVSKTDGIPALFVYSLEGRDWSGLRPNHGFSARGVIFSSPQKFGLRLHPVWNISPAHPVQLFSFGLDKFSPQQTRGKISTTRTRERITREYRDDCGSKADPGG
jgi:hypothetical protein